jgi:toxin ParE1/3/4
LAFRIADNARRDLVEIWIYIAEDSEISADRVLSALYDQFELLGKSVFLGRRRDDLLPGLS